MDTEISYNLQQVLTETAYVKDVGNCALEAIDEKGLSYFLVIKTVDGRTFILSFGPLIPDLIELPSSYSVSYVKQAYNDEKLAKFIQGWAAPKRGPNFLEVKQIEIDEALEIFRDVKEYFINEQ